MWSNLYQEQQPTGDGGGSSGGSSILTSFGAGGGLSAPQGGTNPADSTGGGQSAAGGSAPSNPSPQGGAKDWRLGLPEELQEDASLRKFSDIPSLAAAYINAQKLIGADKIAIPGKHASEEDWAGVFKKLGLPEDPKDYQLQFKDGVTIDEGFTNEFKSTAYKLGILPKQAQALADWFSEVNAKAESSFVEETKASQLKALDGLKAEWGKVYDANLSRAQLVLKDFANPELIQHLNDSGLGNDPVLIKLLANIGSKFYKEPTIVQGEPGGISGPSSPAEAKKAVDSIMGNLSHPYHHKDHPGHRAAVKEVEGLFQKMFPS